MSTFKHKIVTIKKPRQCVGCLEKFEAGSKMIYYVGIFQGDFQSNYWCAPCDAYITKYSRDFDDGIGEGDLRGEPHYEEFKKEFLEKQNPVA